MGCLLKKIENLFIVLVLICLWGEAKPLWRIAQIFCMRFKNTKVHLYVDMV